jgi:hypothetical protein
MEAGGLGNSQESRDLQRVFRGGRCNSRYFKVFQGLIFSFGSGDGDKGQVPSGSSYPPAMADKYLAGLDMSGESSVEWTQHAQGGHYDNYVNSLNSYFFLLNTKTGILAGDLLCNTAFFRCQKVFDKAARYVR